LRAIRLEAADIESADADERSAQRVANPTRLFFAPMLGNSL
jgi:hypothetical protein